MIRPTSWLPLGLLALLVGLTLWLDQLVQPAERRPDGTNRHDPDLIVENFHARKLGEDGKVLYTLTARRMVHYPDDDSSQLQTLAFDAYEPKQPRVAITSERGRLENGHERVWLEGNVLVNREGSERAEPVKLATDRVLLLPDEGIARTTDPVRLASPSGQALSEGFVLNNKERTLQMNRVRSTYQSPRKR